MSAAQVAKLGAEALFYTALGGDEAGRASAERLGGIGVTVLATVHDAPQTRGISAVGETADRAILVIGAAELGAHRGRRCPGTTWRPATPPSSRATTRRRSRRPGARGALVVTTRRLAQLVESGVRADVLIASATDPSEAVDPAELPGPARRDRLDRGRRMAAATRRPTAARGRWDPAPLPGPPVDSYGCGDSFAAGADRRPGRAASSWRRRSPSAPAAAPTASPGGAPSGPSSEERD